MHSTDLIDNTRRAERLVDVAGLEQLSLPPGSVDLVASSLAIHHLPAEPRRELFRKIHDWLTPGG